MYKPHEIGKRGECLAVELLINKGLKILERNWRYGRTELDIIACNDQFLIICEVKTRSSDQFGSPDEAVTERKMEALAVAGAAYQEEKQLDLEFRFDIISVLFNGDEVSKIDHLEDAFHL